MASTVSTNRQADGPLTAELRRSALNLFYDEEPMPDINPDTLDVRVASELFSGLREWNQNTAETLRLTIRYQGRLVPTVGGVLLFGKRREEFFPDAWIQCGRFDGTEKATSCRRNLRKLAIISEPYSRYGASMSQPME